MQAFIHEEVQHGKPRQAGQGSKEAEKTAGAETEAVTRSIQAHAMWAFLFCRPAPIRKRRIVPRTGQDHNGAVAVARL